MTLTGCPEDSDVKSTVGGWPRRFTMRTTAATAATAKRMTVTVTFHAKLMTNPRFVPDDPGTMSLHGQGRRPRSSAG